MYMLKNKEKVFIPEPIAQKNEKVENNERENPDAVQNSEPQQEV